MGQCRLLLVSVCNVILVLTIALESQMGSLFLIHGLHTLWIAHSTHSWLEMSQKEVWAKESCPTCSSHEVPENSAPCLPCPRPKHIFVYCPGAYFVSHCSKSVMTPFLPRQGLQPAHNQKPPALFLSFHGNIDCPAIPLTEGCVSVSCSPAQSLLWL